ncbi:4-phosphoerythronate dehydrogenase PdxB [Bacteroides sp. 519]|uniref:4-phosphoerythronate dehydrogenase PdxB n=1 Tax=Bacteroides sp. 519 TaxID=2302937 RepID=UPI0013D283FD|nr:4-phosphoerythronate dehydrogenase PdxB [Bacteroides sp. 519]NDV58081.1 4-phosphoerythronate dehydrogenase PdxB [Bacteroides sp. 519]
MRIIIDDKIPFIADPIRQITDDVLFVPGSKFTPDIVKNADALIVRTRTKCNKQLLEGSKVQFIATATIGFDHIDTEYCRQKGIVWTNAPGSNSASVAQYIESCLILLEPESNFPLKDKTIGIIGVGNVGSKIKTVAESLGLNVLLNDPPRAAAEGKAGFAEIDEILENSDIITFHVPLVKDGQYKTWHLGNENFFNSLKRKPVIINTSRGEVINTQAILAALESHKIANAIIDVWENEPEIDRTLLDKAIISTPHIAGYSADGKANATRMSLEALCKHFNIDTHFSVIPPPPENNVITANSMNEALIKIYDPRIDSRMLKEQPELFEWLRGNYPVRREKGAFGIKN